MNEGKVTGAFILGSVLMLALGLFVSWPVSNDDATDVSPGQPLFKDFTDPLSAASLKIVRFDEGQGSVDTFEVRRNRESGQWTIPSRKGYPADAVEQMQQAANALVGLKILDEQTRNAEDHEALGVIEPKLESLKVGDTGVGRLVTFRDEKQDQLASLIIGDPVKDEEGKVYVRKPGQDPVYVVKLDESKLTTNFQDWIEDDLLKMSSIDIERVTLKDYATSMTGRGEISIDRNYNAEVELDAGQWSLAQLAEYPSDNPLADPVNVAIPDDQTINSSRMNDLQNALDDLKIVDVLRKPEGMSSNLRADKSLVSDNEAVRSLATRGFFPLAAGTNGEYEMLSANGEMVVTLNDGVEYILRFGNVSGLGEEEQTDGEDGADSSTSVNRYLLVTAQVNEDKFPAPELQPIPETIEDLKSLLGINQPKEEPKTETSNTDGKDASKTEEPSSDEGASSAEAMKEESPAKPDATEEPASEEASADEAAKKEKENAAKESAPKESDNKPAESKEEPAGNAPKKEAEPANSDTKQEPNEPAAEKAAEKVTEESVEGSGEGSAEGQGALMQDDQTDQATEPKADNDEGKATQEGKSESDGKSEDDGKPGDDGKADDDGELSFDELTEDEKLERLEAEQEKIKKENTRRLDERKDKIQVAKRRVRDLNDRFADWYYVIPESTYKKLRIQRDELLVPRDQDAVSAGPSMGAGGFTPPGGMSFPSGLTPPQN